MLHATAATGPTPSTAPLARAYAACEALARAHYENFPVASHLLPAPMRPHVAALYAFARVADDIADEGEAAAADRRMALAAWQRRLHDRVAADPAAECRDDQGDLILAATASCSRRCQAASAIRRSAGRASPSSAMSSATRANA